MKATASCPRITVGREGDRFEPYNRHLLHDLGAFQLGLGAVLALAAFPERVDGLAVLLLVAGAARWTATRMR